MQELGYSKNNQTFPCWFKKENIEAVQFHPERSSLSGKSFFKNIINNYEKNNY